MHRRYLASGLGVLGVVAVAAGCSTSWTPWVTPSPTPTPKATLPPFESLLRISEMSDRTFAPGEEIRVDVHVNARSLPTAELTVNWCDGYNASKSIDSSRVRIVKHLPFVESRSCWLVVQLFDSNKVEIGNASMSFSVATKSATVATPTPAPADSATPSATPAPATPTPVPPTPGPTWEPISPYRVL